MGERDHVIALVTMGGATGHLECVDVPSIRTTIVFISMLRTFRAHVEVQGVMQSLDMCADMVLNRKLRQPLHHHDWKDIMADFTDLRVAKAGEFKQPRGAVFRRVMIALRCCATVARNSVAIHDTHRVLCNSCMQCLCSPSSGSTLCR